MVSVQSIDHHGHGYLGQTHAAVSVMSDIPTAENIAALILPTCEPEINEKSSRQKEDAYLVSKVEQTDGKATEDNGEVQP